jgi:uncharacterized RDD family membrane protein YckC
MAEREPSVLGPPGEGSAAPAAADPPVPAAAGDGADTTRMEAPPAQDAADAPPAADEQSEPPDGSERSEPPDGSERSEPSDGSERSAPSAGSERPSAATARPAPAPRRREAPVFHVAGFWRRAAGAAIDLAIILPVSLLLAWLTGKIADIHLPTSRHGGVDFWLDLLLASDPALFGAIGLTLAIGAVYAMLFQATMGQTPGMRALKTRIIDAYGDPPAIGLAGLRTFGYLLALATFGLGFLWIGFDSEKRGLHDWVSRTYVVKVPAAAVAKPTVARHPDTRTASPGQRLSPRAGT